jgi:hypothetical protein
VLTGNIPASNDEAIMDTKAYRISDLPIGKTKAYEEIKEGRLRAVKCGKITLILLDDYDRWLKSLSPLIAKPSDLTGHNK